MASENLAKLQATANRFAKDADFSPLVIDGGMGPDTILALGLAFAYASSDKAKLETANTSQANQGVIDAAQYFNGLQAGDPATFIMQNVVGMNVTLGAVADGLGLTQAAQVALTKPTTIQNTIGDKSAFKVKPPAGMNPLDAARLWFRQLSTVGQAGVGGGALILLIMGMSAWKKRGGQKKPSGYRGGY